MKVVVFPHSFVRYTPIHFYEFETFAVKDELLNELLVLEQAKEISKNRCCDELYDHIQAASDNKERQRLLNIKRAVFNDRISADIPEKHRALLLKLREKHLQWDAVFRQQLTTHRKMLQQWAQHELLHKGLLLSSPTLYSQLPSFIMRDPAAFRHKEQKNEYSLLRYLTRMSFKTSPFSTFTYTGVATSGDNYTLPVVARLSSGVRLNNKLFDYIRLLMIHHPVLNEILEVQLNPTVVKENDHVQFLAAYRNIEAFQKMPGGSVVQWLHSLLTKPVAIRTLTDTLSTHIPDTDREQVKRYLLQLVSSGYLEAGIGCSAIDPEWDRQLLVFIKQHLPGHPLQELLLQLQQKRELYALAPPAKRYHLLQEAGQALHALLTTLQQEAGVSGTDIHNGGVEQEVRHQQERFDTTRFMSQQFPVSAIFYEDTYTTEKAVLPQAATEALVNKVEQLCTLLESLDTMQEERIRMRDFFLRHYGEHHQESITSFYKTYYQQEKKQQKEERKKGTSLSLTELLQPFNITGETIHLTVNDFHTITQTAPCARGMFVQLFHDETGELCGVINHLLPGMGKVAGRFLDLFDPVITSHFNEWNERLHPGVMQLELSDGSSFNANIHPPLLPYGIRIPGGHSNYPANKLVPLSKVAVKYNPSTQLLSLVHTPDNKEIYAYDLSLQSFFNRSNFYQLLAHFNPDRRVSLRGLINAADERFPADKEHDIVSKPRITFERTVIIRRKAWVIKTSCIPLPGNDEADAAYYARLATWRLNAGLPEHVFLFLKSYAIPAGPEEKARMMKDDYKPQYICFTKPLLVILFRKLLSRAGKHIYLEEMLPHVSQVQQVTEHLIHWYKYV